MPSIVTFKSVTHCTRSLSLVAPERPGSSHFFVRSVHSFRRNFGRNFRETIVEPAPVSTISCIVNAVILYGLRSVRTRYLSLANMLTGNSGLYVNGMISPCGEDGMDRTGRSNG